MRQNDKSTRSHINVILNSIITKQGIINIINVRKGKLIIISRVRFLNFMSTITPNDKR